MGRSNRKSSKSPIQHYFGWVGFEGSLSFYDKEKKEKVMFPNMNFILLEDDMSSLGGFSDQHNSGIRSNEVRNLQEEEMDVYIGNKKVATGLYADLKNTVHGAKFVKPLYIALLKKDGTMEYAKLELRGAAFSAWLNFLGGKEEYIKGGKIDPYAEGLGIRVAGKSKMKKKGKTEYYEPAFELIEINPEQSDEALKMDEVVQEFLDKAPAASTNSNSSNETSDDDPTDSGDDTPHVDFEEPEALQHSQDVNDLPF